jgi:hypothetical protein
MWKFKNSAPESVRLSGRMRLGNQVAAQQIGHSSLNLPAFVGDAPQMKQPSAFHLA